MKTVGVNEQGEIIEPEWCKNLEKCPKLYEALEADLDPDTGRCEWLCRLACLWTLHMMLF